MAENNDTGKNGEKVARAYLEKNGYKILEANWRFHHYELDIVATNNEELVIVEVKTRSDKYLVAPEKSIDRRKIRRIVAASDAYTRKYNIDLPVRFDVICLIKKGSSLIIENHIEDAFYAPVIK
ncbi:MAG: YraN family protein [Tannerella sp.]|jgi:putative endonuclease|nr:YraN family protein [Tannerella sp.]